VTFMATATASDGTPLDPATRWRSAQPCGNGGGGVVPLVRVSNKRNGSSGTKRVA